MFPHHMTTEIESCASRNFKIPTHTCSCPDDGKTHVAIWCDHKPETCKWPGAECDIRPAFHVVCCASKPTRVSPPNLSGHPFTLNDLGVGRGPSPKKRSPAVPPSTAGDAHNRLRHTKLGQ
uniref:Uncharacterized protein n=1 Tax=Branchiostoma floridae TaxID=7739 RepID=C3Y523_BRAFL|eukprot:XP_002608546.1 hypothetical protein BRAFLDRAFT_98916 [Branchiostoma floridae]